ncbi:DNA replication/repair protein RecF [Motiliproteus coralliicola]|uniref:DNA replication and repair protein RecF n=1 Tax=Motiliproteus coralliicola TaxID=2283196 RepID=A0A369WH75_9GAMM|nr:DNA replication/repair protein RecF [Motiliproteus coralliicola]RDE18805.1 DNA replication/repair protein RecF [Motiliproteus coralliicola]
MSISQLSITQLRNLASLKLELSSQTNLFYGPNGSGKTSILEAVHLLSLARSFRTNKHKHYIQHQQPESVLFARVQGPQGELPVGFQRSQDASLKVRIGGEPIDAVAELAELVPIQLINSDTFRLLEGSPSIRRQYIDWGGFHLESRFMAAWKAVRRALSQRNSLLKYGKLEPSVRAAWDREFIDRANELDGYRRTYLEQLIPCFERLLAELVELDQLSLHYHCGWDQKKGLDQVLEQGFERDRQLGFTQQGPQRADLKVKMRGMLASEVLSRGQQKLVVSALKVAQGYLLRQQTERRCIYLIDDLPAELDRHHRQRLCRLLEQLDSQVLVTSTDREAFEGCWSEQVEVREFPIRNGALANIEGNGS